MSTYKPLALIACAGALAACASSPGPAPAPAQAPAAQVAASVVSSNPAPRLVKSIDGKYTGEVIGVIAEGTRFSKLKIGMSTDDVQAVFGRTPDRSHTYESGKRWIPFYFGNDARRMQVLYKNEGCLIFTGGNVWGGGGGDLIQIESDPSGKCYQQ
ncbi:hypothetical protein IP87_17880 [beta proteobacterium AAP121]|nr:hypothetical protein IP80_10800 [beta proteobacterium AAP65]KPF95006.1 hypothetical protein IP87_17880 [beta proteobacterium AAP121]